MSNRKHRLGPPASPVRLWAIARSAAELGWIIDIVGDKGADGYELGLSDGSHELVIRWKPGTEQGHTWDMCETNFSTGCGPTVNIRDLDAWLRTGSRECASATHQPPDQAAR